MALKGKTCRCWRPLMPPQCKWIAVKWLGCVKELSCVVHAKFRGDQRLWKQFTALFPQRTGSAYRLDKGYIERKAVERKLTGIALNRSKNHIGERTTDRGLQVRFLFLLVGIVFSHTNPYNFAVTQRPPLRSHYNTHTTQNKGHTVYISPTELGVPVSQLIVVY